jgi:hypothetical protein
VIESVCFDTLAHYQTVQAGIDPLFFMIGRTADVYLVQKSEITLIRMSCSDFAHKS